MYQKSSLKKHNNDIPDHYHLDENQEVDQYSIGGYNPFIPQYHPFKEIPVKMEYAPAPIYMISLPNPTSYVEMDQNQIYFSYQPQPPSQHLESQPIKQVKQRKQYKSKIDSYIEKQQNIPPPQQQILSRGDESENEFFQYPNYEMDKTEDDRKLFEQTLTGFVLKLFDSHQSCALGERYIVEQVRANISKLKRPDGSRYKGNLYKTVKGSLTSNGIFKMDYKKENESYWTVCNTAAEEFQKRTIERIVQFTDKKKSNKKVKIQDDSVTTKELQEHIKFDYAHAFGLLNGFLETQPNLRRTLEQIDMNEVERSRSLLRLYNMELVQQGIKECQDFFSELLKKPKHEILQQ